MKDPHEQRIQNQFGGFCTKVLKNEAAHIHNEYAKQRENEKSLDDLSLNELSQIAVTDKYFADEHIFEVLGKPVVVSGDLLAEAIAKLPEDRRDIILHYYIQGHKSSTNVLLNFPFNFHTLTCGADTGNQ